MKIALAQLNFHIADFEGNFELIKHSIENARKDGVDLVVFSELAVCGYPPQDLLELKDFNNKCRESVDQIARLCTDIAAIVGSPSINSSHMGKKLYNSAFFLFHGEIQSVVHKALLPDYDVFDEERHFEPCRDFNVIEFKGYRIALTISADLLDDQPTDSPLGNKLHTCSPIYELFKQKPDFIINIAALPFSYHKEKIKKRIFVEKVTRYRLPLFYVNQVGGNTELIFDGGSMVMNADGDVISEMATFREDYNVYDVGSLLLGGYRSEPASIIEDIEKLHDALVLGIRDFFTKMGFRMATLGLSGGIDSALTLVLAVEALGKENVRVLLMPSKYSSDHSIFDAIALAEKLNVRFDIIPIHDIYHQFEATLRPLFSGLDPDITEASIQSRIRGTILMAISNKFGHILLNTSNKSEGAIGYGTLYGDINGGLSVLGDVYKTMVYELASFINRHLEIIPMNTIRKLPSTEFSQGQKDADLLPEYEILDQILHHYIEDQLSSGEIVELGFDKSLVDHIIQLVNRNEYKRFQTPPVLRISSKAFGVGRRVPIAAKY